MRYLVKEMHEGPAGVPADGKVFKSISAALQFVKKSNKGGKVLFGNLEATEGNLAALLKERLSTVTLSVVNGAVKKFAITAFEDVANT